MSLGKTTRLEAINTMLGFIGEAPMNSLEDNTGGGDSPIAEQILDEISREVQGQGWEFNTNYDEEHTPDSNKEIILSENVIRADVKVSQYPNVDVSLRGKKLYNRADNTFEFDDPIKLKVVSVVPWDDLPEPARRYITLRSARILQDRQVGSTELTQLGIREEVAALAALREYDAESADYSIFDSHLPAHTISDYRRTTAY